MAYSRKYYDGDPAPIGGISPIPATDDMQKPVGIRDGQLFTKQGIQDSEIVTEYADLDYPVDVGQYCLYNERIFKCIVRIPVSEPFDYTHWENVVWLNDQTDRVTDAIDEAENRTDAAVSATQTATAAMQGTVSAEITRLNDEFDDFFDRYVETLGVEQTTGTSTTQVMSQKATTDALTDNANAVADIDKTVNSIYLVPYATGVQQSSKYYHKITALSANSTYTIKFTPTLSGSVTLQAGTSASTGSMVDTIFTGTVTANTETVVKHYHPTGAYTYLRITQNSDWTSAVFTEEVNLAGRIGTLETDALKSVKEITLTAAEFAAAPYNSLLGNLPINTVFSLTASYHALDYPLDVEARTSIFTFGPANVPVQLAIHTSGSSFTRSKNVNGWQAWKRCDGIASSEIVITSSNTHGFTSYNDFPINSIVRVYNNAILSDAPAGWNTIGHATTDPGKINSITMTYTPTAYDPSYICQMTQIYRSANEGYPRIAFRTAVRQSGSVYAWSKWSLMSEDGALHATNKVVDINSYQTITFSDFNDAPANTIYQVDYNVGSTILHNPAPGKSGVLMTYAFSVSTRHGLVQTHFAYESTKATMYFRYGFEQSASTYIWSAWEKVNSTTQEV